MFESSIADRDKAIEFMVNYRDAALILCSGANCDEIDSNTKAAFPHIFEEIVPKIMEMLRDTEAPVDTFPHKL